MGDIAKIISAITDDNALVILIITIIVSLAQVTVKAMSLVFTHYANKPSAPTSSDTTSAVMCALHDDKLTDLESNVNSMKTNIDDLMDIINKEDGDYNLRIYTPPGLVKSISAINTTLDRVNRFLDKG